MKNYYFLLLITSIFYSQTLKSQITYDSSDFAEIDEFYDVISIGAGSGLSDFDFESTGSDFNWDFSELSSGDQINYGHEDPNNSPYKDIWCLYNLYLFNCDEMFNDNFNMGLNLGQTLTVGEFELSDIYNHAYRSDTGFEVKMIGGTIHLEEDFSGFLQYSDSDKWLNFPIVYNDSYTDNNSISMDFNPLGISFTINSDGVRNNVVEGYGSLEIPGHVFPNTLKLKSTLVQNYDITYNGENIQNTSTSVTYYWFDKDFGIPVLTIFGTEINEQFVPTSAIYIDFGLVGTNDFSAKNYSLYPNPTNGELNLKLENNTLLKNIEIFDSNGRLVGRELNLNGRPAGVYLIKIETSKGTFTEKIIKK